MVSKYPSGKNYSSISNNRLVSFVFIVSCLLFLGVVVGEKSRFFYKIIPTIRGEIKLADKFVITTIKQRYPIIIKKNDPFIGQQLRYSGSVKSLFAETADYLCKPGYNVVEIGAHYGFNTLILGDKLKNNGKYYAIEANSVVASYLNKNVVLNDLSNTVKIINAAISDHIGNCQIDDVISYRKHKEHGHHCSMTSISVKCSTLDNEIKDDKISLLMIDVPGFEFPIIHGAKRLMERSDDIKLLISINTRESLKNNIDVRNELISLRDMGFKFFEVEDSVQYKPITIDKIISKKNLVLIIQKDKAK